MGPRPSRHWPGIVRTPGVRAPLYPVSGFYMYINPINLARINDFVTNLAKIHDFAINLAKTNDFAINLAKINDFVINLAKINDFVTNNI